MYMYIYIHYVYIYTYRYVSDACWRAAKYYVGGSVAAHRSQGVYSGLVSFTRSTKVVICIYIYMWWEKIWPMRAAFNIMDSRAI